MELDSRQTTILAIVVLFLGKYLNQKIPFFRDYNIPQPVTGGVTASLFFCMVYVVFDVAVNFSLEQRDSLLVIFFTTIGLSSRFSTLVEGGKSLLILLVLAVCYLFVQNFTGIGVAEMMGLDPHVGLIGGSVSLSGGHGTTIAWAPTFKSDFGIENAMEIGIACATFGLVLGGMIGGPIAKYLIQKHKLESSAHEKITVGVEDEQKKVVTAENFFFILLALGLSIGIGLHVHDAITIKLPVFVTCLFGGILFTNVILPFFYRKRKDKPLEKEGAALALISEVSLGLFLAMSLMSLQLWTLVSLALPIMMILLAQVVIATLFVVFIVFRALGKDYDAAIISSGYIGLALGATPTAIANMTAVTKKFGASPKAFIIVPLVGAFFIDISNAMIIKTIIAWLG